MCYTLACIMHFMPAMQLMFTRSMRTAPCASQFPLTSTPTTVSLHFARFLEHDSPITLCLQIDKVTKDAEEKATAAPAVAATVRPSHAKGAATSGVKQLSSAASLAAKVKLEPSTSAGRAVLVAAGLESEVRYTSVQVHVASTT